jgi:hypothetical protein
MCAQGSGFWFILTKPNRAFTAPASAAQFVCTRGWPQADICDHAALEEQVSMHFPVQLNWHLILF